MFNLGGIRQESNCPFCPGQCCERLTKIYETWSRVFDLEDTLFPVDVKDIIFCILHAGLQIVDEFMEILTARMRLEGPNGIAQIKQVANSLGVPYQLYEEDGEDFWRITSYNGLQAQTILDNIERFTRLWPRYRKVNYSHMTVKALRLEAFKAMEDGELPYRTLPRLKASLVELLESINTEIEDLNETELFMTVGLILYYFFTIYLLLFYLFVCLIILCFYLFVSYLSSRLLCLTYFYT